MKTTSHFLTLRKSRLTGLLLVGLAVGTVSLAAQSIGGSAATPTPGTSASSVTSPPTANVSPYNSPKAGTGASAAQTYNPNASNPPSGAAKTGTVTTSANAGGGSGSGQVGGSTSTSNP